MAPRPPVSSRHKNASSSRAQPAATLDDEAVVLVKKRVRAVWMCPKCRLQAAANLQPSADALVTCECGNQFVVRAPAASPAPLRTSALAERRKKTSSSSKRNAAAADAVASCSAAPPSNLLAAVVQAGRAPTPSTASPSSSIVGVPLPSVVSVDSVPLDGTLSSAAEGREDDVLVPANVHRWVDKKPVVEVQSDDLWTQLKSMFY